MMPSSFIHTLTKPLRLFANLSSVQVKSRPLFEVQKRTMANHRHKKIIKLAKGFTGRGKNCYSIAYRRVTKARQYAYRDRKVKKRNFRTLWIQRLNAAARIYDLPYSSFINNLSKTNITLDRKVLADMAITEPLSFKSVLEVSRAKA